jgi:hypothetical protein
MDSPTFSGITKWQALKSALSSALVAVERKVYFGLDVFPARTVATNCEGTACCEIGNADTFTMAVPPPASTSQILTAFDDITPGGRTPMAAALARARTRFSQYPHGVDRYVLLITDGGPDCNPNLTCETEACTDNLEPSASCPASATENCCSAPFGLGCLDDSRVTAEIGALKQLGVRTVVFGLPGSEPYSAQLDQFAVAGGLPNTDGPDSHYSVDATQGVEALAGALQGIFLSLATSCTFEFPRPPPPKFNLMVNCTAISQSQKDIDGSWTVEPLTLTLTGAACEAYLSNARSRVDYALGCPPRGPS